MAAAGAGTTDGAGWVEVDAGADIGGTVAGWAVDWVGVGMD